MDLEFNHLYKNLLIHHLERSEIEYELTIRAVQFVETESRSAIQRRLRDRLKEEKEKKSSDLDFIRCYKSIDAEIKEIDENLLQIRNFLENKTRFEGIRESLKTRLVHYFARARRAQEAADRDEDLEDLDKIISGIREMSSSHFPAVVASEVVKEQVMQQIVQTLSHLNLQSSRTQLQSRVGSQNALNTEDHLLDEAAGGSKETEPANSSSRRSLKSLRKAGNGQSLLDLSRRVSETLSISPINSGRRPRGQENPEKVINKFSLEPNSIRNRVQPRETSECVSSTGTDSSSSSSGSLDPPPRPRAHRRYTQKRRPVSEWNLKYDGKDNGQSLMRFIKEVQFYAKSEKVSDKELFRSAIYLFKDQAKVWFMSGIENEDFSSWKELVSELKREFLSPDHDHVNEIRAISRKQGPKERFSDFLAEMQRIFNSLTRPMTEKKKFEIVFRNLRADYKAHAIASNIDNLADLKKFGRQLDATFWFKFNTNAQDPSASRNRAQVNEVSLGQKPRQNPAADDPNRKFKSRQFYRSKPERSDEESTRQRPQEPAKPTPPKPKTDDKGLQVLLEKYKVPAPGTCFNCRLPGHHATDCEGPKHKYCRKCGFLNYDTDHCPFCAKNAQ